jgi:hypothetical protein
VSTSLEDALFERALAAFDGFADRIGEGARPPARGFPGSWCADGWRVEETMQTIPKKLQ